MILWGKDEASINVKFSKRDINSILKIILKKNKRKELNFNGEIIKQKDLPGLLTMILFSPEDLMLIKGSPLLRRRFIDIELSQISRIYYNELVQYNRLLLQRNNLLKARADFSGFMPKVRMLSFILALLAILVRIPPGCTLNALTPQFSKSNS